MAHNNLGNRPGATRGKLDEAIAEYREAIRLKPDYADAHYNLGIALATRGKLDEAIAEYRSGHPAQARFRRGPQQPRHRPARPGASRTRRSPSTARPSASSPITPRPTTTSAPPCATRGKLDEAIAEFREAIRLKPDYADAHNNLGIAL